MITYEKIPDGFDFSTKFPTYVLAFCPDTCSWFATNERFFYYEYSMEFPNEALAIEYFKENPEVFLKLEEDVLCAYRPSFYEGGVYLRNINELISVSVNKTKFYKDEFGEPE